MNRLFSKKSMPIISMVVIVVVTFLLSFFTLQINKEKPLNATELLDLGEKYLQELDYEEAIVQFIKLIEIEPMNVRAYLGGADAYLHLDKQSDALDLLKAGIEATDNENLSHALTGVKKSIIEGYIAIAEAYEAEGWHEKAMEILQRVYNETGDEVIGRKLGIVEASTIEFREDYIIQWKDAEFERLIRECIGKPNGDIHYNDVKLIEKINIWGEIIEKKDENFSTSYSQESFWLGDGREGGKTGKIRSLLDLEHFTSLNDLSVNYQTDLSIEALADTDGIDCLKRLKRINLTADNISDISVVSQLIALEGIDLGYNNITDISPISMLIELKRVSIHDNERLASAEPLRGLRKLSSASISSVNTVDLNVFVGMPEFTSLNLVSVENVDYSILTKLQLDYLEITCDDATFQTVKQLDTLTNLRIHGQGNYDSETGQPLGGITSVSGIEALTNLTNLDLLAPNCRDISALASLKVEQVELELPDDCDLTPLTKMANLKKVIVPYDDSSLIDKVRSLIPNVEVTSDRY